MFTCPWQNREGIAALQEATTHHHTAKFEPTRLFNVSTADSLEEHRCARPHDNPTCSNTVTVSVHSTWAAKAVKSDGLRMDATKTRILLSELLQMSFISSTSLKPCQPSSAMRKAIPQSLECRQQAGSMSHSRRRGDMHLLAGVNHAVEVRGDIVRSATDGGKSLVARVKRCGQEERHSKRIPTISTYLSKAVGGEQYEALWTCQCDEGFMAL